MQTLYVIKKMASKKPSFLKVAACEFYILTVLTLPPCLTCKYI